MRATRVGRPFRTAILVLLAGVLVASPGPAQEVTPPASPTPPALGTISGTVIDKSSRSPIIEAGVEVVGKGKTVRTDIEGKYSIKLPEGTYELRLFAPGYKGLRVKDVAVKPAQVTKTPLGERRRAAEWQ